MDLEAITKAIEENPELLTGLTNHVLSTDKGKEVITNKANVIYEEKIASKVNELHGMYDNDVLTILGEQPGTNEDGSKQKTYSKVKQLLTELKDLRGQKDSLSKDAEVARLTAEIETLKKDGGAQHWKAMFDTEKDKWLAEREDLTSKLKATSHQTELMQKQSDIDAGLRGLKFDEKVPEDARKALVKIATNDLIKNSKIQDGKIIYTDANGVTLNNDQYAPKSAAEILKDSLKSILHNENTNKGGGAPTTIKGSIRTTTNAEGKSVQTLDIQEGSYSNKREFMDVAHKNLTSAGITKDDPKYQEMVNEAYNRLEVAKLPR